MSKIVYLTSSPDKMDWSVMPPKPICLIEDNQFVERLKADLPENVKCLMVASNPDGGVITDSVKDNYMVLLPQHGISVERIDVLDHRVQMTKEEIHGYDFIILCGGHVPTQNAYFKEIHLKETLQDFDGVIMGISAGSMNSALICYAQPEEDEEVEDEHYERFIEGLGLSDYMILPHWQFISTQQLAGRRIAEDITYPDSMGRTFYAIVDGSYFRVTNEDTVLYGEAYKISNGKMTQIQKIDEEYKMQN